MIFVAFDIYTLRSQTLKHNLFHSAVVFSEMLVNQTLREKSFQYKDLQYFGKLKLGPKYAANLYKEAVKLHDIGLLEKGQYGNAHYGHRCDDVSFSHKIKKQIENKKQNELPKILSRDLLYVFQKQLNETERLYYNTALNRQGDDLCNGKQIRVSDLLIFIKDIG